MERRLAALRLLNRNESSYRHGPLVREAVGPQDGKSELKQFGKLFVGGLDYCTTDSRAALSSGKVPQCVSLCSSWSLIECDIAKLIGTFSRALIVQPFPFCEFITVREAELHLL